MANSDEIRNMYDVALKPRLLRSLLKEFVPDEKHPFRSPSDLSYVVNVVQTHRLLSEYAGPKSTADPKLMESWKLAVDSWVNRLITLISSNMPDKCWAGICLLGVTSQECSSERFLSSYSTWLSKLSFHIQSSADSQFLKVASCASISDLFTRLGDFPNAKKEGTSQATKLVQLLLKLLNEDSSDVVWEEAVRLLCTIINVFPASVHRHYDSVESAFASKIMSGKCSATTLKKLGQSLALLPRAAGDEDSWSLLMQKILVSINMQLNDVFQSLEEEVRSNEVMRTLFPPGKDPPLPLGGHSVPGGLSDEATKRREQFLMSRISALMLCCCSMLTKFYPFQVAVPVGSLLALAKRVLSVDGSFSDSLSPVMTLMKQEFVCSELPVLHLYCLELLTALVQGLRSQLLPHAAQIIRTLMEYFRTCMLPELRIKAYHVVKLLLTSMGVGTAMYLIQDVIDNAFTDLNSTICENGAYGVSSKVSFGGQHRVYQRKRKHTNVVGSLEEQPDGDGLDVEKPQDPTPISVKIAALEALETLLTVGGALRSASWRGKIDRLLISVAAKASQGQQVILCCESAVVQEDYQLAALRALLASLLSPSHVRPPHLAHGLELFRKGTQKRGTKVADYCAYALLSLEVLIHPRALPVIDYKSTIDDYHNVNRKVPGNVSSSARLKTNMFYDVTLGKGSDGAESDDDDDLYKRWMSNDHEDVPGTEVQKNTDHIHEQPTAFSTPSLSKVPFKDGTSLTEVPHSSEVGGLVPSGSGRIITDEDEIMAESQGSQDIKQSKEHHPEVENVPAIVNDKSGGVASENNILGSTGNMVAADNEFTAKTALGATSIASDNKDVQETKKETNSSIFEKHSAYSEKSIGIMVELDDETESIPDIVDADPDSD